MLQLTKESILSFKDALCEKVEVPEWGGFLFMRSLTGRQRDKIEDSMVRVKGKDAQANLINLRAKMVCMSACDEEGNRLFTDADFKELGEKNAAVLDRLFVIARRLSGMSQEDVDDLTKNSSGVHGEDSFSD